MAKGSERSTCRRAAATAARLHERAVADLRHPELALQLGPLGPQPGKLGLRRAAVLVERARELLDLEPQRDDLLRPRPGVGGQRDDEHEERGVAEDRHGGGAARRR